MQKWIDSGEFGPSARTYDSLPVYIYINGHGPLAYPAMSMSRLADGDSVVFSTEAKQTVFLMNKVEQFRKDSIQGSDRTARLSYR